MKIGMSKDNTKAIKGIVIVLMIFHHLFRAPQIYKGFTPNFFPFNESDINNITTFFKLCVGTFAFLSGYGLSKSWKKAKQSENISTFIKKRYIKTFSSFWIVFLLSCIFCQLLDWLTFNTYFKEGISVKTLFDFGMSFLGLSRIMGLEQLCYEWWYMSAYAIFLVLVPLLCEITEKIGGFATIASITLFPRMCGIEFLGGTWPFSFIMAIYLGVLCNHNEIFEEINSYLSKCKNLFIETTVRIVISMVLLYISYYVYMRLPNTIYWEIVYGVVPTAVVVAFYIILTVLPNILNKLLILLGNHSMNIYLIHTLILRYTKPLIFNLPHFVISGIALLGISLIFSILIELIKKQIYFLA